MKCSLKFLTRREETFTAGGETTHAPQPRDRFAGRSWSKSSVRAGFGKRKYPMVACGNAFALAAQAEALNQLLVAADILALQVVEQAAALTDHDQETTTAVEVLLVGLEVFGQVADALGQDGDLDFRRTGIALTGLVFLDDFLLAFGSNRHRDLRFYSRVDIRGSVRAPGGFLRLQLWPAPPACRRKRLKRQPHRPTDHSPGFPAFPDPAGATVPPFGQVSVGALPLPSGRTPGCRPAPSRSEAEVFRRRHLAPVPPDRPGKSLFQA